MYTSTDVVTPQDERIRTGLVLGMRLKPYTGQESSAHPV